MQAAQLGYYRGILNQLDAIEAAEPASAAWVAQMRSLAQQFRFEEICAALLKPAAALGAAP
jgi:hypothetical protein